MKKSNLGLFGMMFTVSFASACGQQLNEKNSASLLDETDSSGQDLERAKEAQSKVHDLVFGYESAHTVGIAECGAKWASVALGFPITHEVEFFQLGVRVSFSDEKEFKNFARASLIFGGKIPTLQGDVLICADQEEGGIIHPVAGGSNQ